MEYHTKEAARLLGVSVRTLQYYDGIGLVCPRRAGANYRVYTMAEIARMQEVLFFRELGLPLSEIRAILASPDYDRKETLEKHRLLLLEKQRQLAATLALLDGVLEGKDMKKQKCSQYAEMKEQYRDEVRERWGRTEEYRTAQAKDAARSDTENAAVLDGANAIFDAFAALVPCDPASAEAQRLVQRWQAYITEHMYPCSREILRGLGAMYTADERFRANLDAHGAGTAALMHDAIAVYCG